MKLEELEKRIGYVFDDKLLLAAALTHRTYLNENKSLVSEDNQRLEFLGDTIVNAIVTRMLYLKYNDENEGLLTKLRAELVSESALARIARHLDLGQYLLLGKGEDRTGGRDKDSVLADAYEAFVGALFLDSSYDEVSDIIGNHFLEALGPFDEIDITDYKSALIEYCQAKFKALPEISVVEESGPDHEKTFVVAVRLADGTVASGEGRNKKQAAQNACREALKSLG